MLADAHPTMPTLSLRKRLSFTLVVVLLLTLSVEIGLRVAWKRPPRFLGEGLRETNLFVKDPDLGWRMRPNQSIEFMWHWGTTTTITTNSAGYRDREHAYEPQSDRPRVMILGDSHAFGFGVDDTDLLSERVRELQPDVEVLNLAVSGYNVAQSSAALESDGLKYRPNLVVLAFVQNDVANQVIPAELSRAHENVDGGIKAFFGKHSRLYEFTTSRINSNKSLVRFLVRCGIKDGLAGYEKLDTNLRPFLKRYPPSLTREWDETLREIQRLRAMGETVSARFVLLIVPAKQSVLRDNLISSLTYVNYSPDDFDLDKPYRALAEFCAEFNITCVDPTPRFREAYDAGRNPYLLSDLHVNREGHRILADAIVSAIEADPDVGRRQSVND